MDSSEKLKERNKKILADYKKARKKNTIDESLKKVADKWYLSTSSINQIVFNPKRKYSPLKTEKEEPEPLKPNLRNRK